MDSELKQKSSILGHQDTGLTVSVFLVLLILAVAMAAVVYYPTRPCRWRRRREEQLSLTANQIT